MGDADLRTSATLLGRLRQQPTDQAAWSEFVDRYGHGIYGWCRRWNLQDADAKDVTQAVLASLCTKMKTFTYDPALSFRGWLRTADPPHPDATSWRPVGSPSSATEARSTRDCLDSLEARDDLIGAAQRAIRPRAARTRPRVRVRLRVEPHTWEAFRLTADRADAGAAVAERLRMKVATVFKAKSKVQKMLREEIGRLEGSDPGNDAERSLKHEDLECSRLCPSPDQLRRLLADELGEVQEASIGVHVESCSLCQEQLEQLTDTATGSPDHP